MITLCNTLRDKVRGYRLAGRNPHGTRQLLPQSTYISERTVEFLQQPFKALSELLSGFREHDFTRGAIKQPDTRLALQLFHAVAYRGLAQADDLPCPTEAAGMGYGDEDAKLA